MDVFQTLAMVNAMRGGGSGGGGGGDGIAYRVRFYVDGVLYDEQWVPHGESATSPAEPTKDATEQYTYTFARWDGSYSNVTAPKDINAVFTATVKTYTVRFYNEGELYHTAAVPYGCNATLPADPVRPDAESDAFDGWEPEPVNITADMDCYATYKSLLIYSRNLVDGSIKGAYTNDRVTSIGDSAFYGANALTSVCFPAATSIGNNAFYYCSSLVIADFPLVTTIGDNAFNNCKALTSLILRSNTTAVLSGTSTFANSNIHPKNGHIYVPSALIDSYKSATNWSTYASQFRALEEYTVDGTIAGALDTTKI